MAMRDTSIFNNITNKKMLFSFFLYVLNPYIVNPTMDTYLMAFSFFLRILHLLPPYRKRRTHFLRPLFFRQLFLLHFLNIFQMNCLGVRCRNLLFLQQYAIRHDFLTIFLILGILQPGQKVWGILSFFAKLHLHFWIKYSSVSFSCHLDDSKYFFSIDYQSRAVTIWRCTLKYLWKKFQCN